MSLAIRKLLMKFLLLISRIFFSLLIEKIVNCGLDYYEFLYELKCYTELSKQAHSYKVGSFILKGGTENWSHKLNLRKIKCKQQTNQTVGISSRWLFYYLFFFKVVRKIKLKLNLSNEFIIKLEQFI